MESATPEDILKQVDKAINKLAADVEKKLNNLRGYVDEKVIDLEKELNERKSVYMKFFFDSSMASCNLVTGGHDLSELLET